MPKRPTERRRAKEQADKQLFSLRLPIQLWAELSVFAKLKDRSMNELLGEVLGDWWARQPEKTSVARLVKTSGTALTEKEEDS